MIKLMMKTYSSSSGSSFERHDVRCGKVENHTKTIIGKDKQLKRIVLLNKGYNNCCQMLIVFSSIFYLIQKNVMLYQLLT